MTRTEANDQAIEEELSDDLRRRNLFKDLQIKPDPDDQASDTIDRWVTCKSCGQKLALTSDISSEGLTFSNPLGVQFEVVKFRQARNIDVDMEYHDDHSFFPGFAWSFAICNQCQGHLGWHFSADQGSSGFYGLVLAAIRIPL